jgi:hypothetical protein
LIIAVVTASNNLTLAGNYNTVSWSALAGATRYNVYKQRGGSFGYIGQTAALTIVVSFHFGSSSGTAKANQRADKAEAWNASIIAWICRIAGAVCLLIGAGLARAYHGEAKSSWCH